jgi:hypothetical protein
VSHAAHAHAEDDHGHEADGHDHVDAAEGPDELPPDEPKTPLWLTALGGGLFLALAIAWLAARPGEPTLSELSPAASASASASAVEAPPPPPPAPPPAPALLPAPAPTPSGKPAVVPVNKPRLKIQAP